MITKGKAYSLPLTSEPRVLTVRDELANTFILQPQETRMSYRLDGCVRAVCGFLLLEFEVIELRAGAIVIWATNEPHGRVVIQEVRY